MVKSQTKRGVMYVAWGEAHVGVARRSAASVKRHNPRIDTAIWCHENDDTTGFDHGFVIPKGMKRPKVDLLRHSPFEETLYLDNDTLVRADLSSLFDLLLAYDMCGAQVVLWHRPRHQKRVTMDIPESFPEINAGVLLYRRCDAVDRFVQDWTARFAASGMGIDQPTFRETLWLARDLRFYVLPPQFNKRIFEASELIYSDQPRARILHLELLRPQKNPILRWLSNFVR